MRKQGVGRMARYFRGSNLIRHSLVAWPMANFTGFKGDLTNEQAFRNSSMEKPDLENRKIVLSPRFIHFDEWQLFYLQEQLVEKIPLSTWQNRAKRGYEDRFRIKIPVEFLKKEAN